MGVALVLAEYPVHFTAEVLERMATQVNDAIPATNAARLVLFGDNVHKRPRAVWHPLEHDNPAGAECILQLTWQELQFRLDVREPCDSRLRGRSEADSQSALGLRLLRSSQDEVGTCQETAR